MILNATRPRNSIRHSIVDYEKQTKAIALKFLAKSLYKRSTFVKVRGQLLWEDKFLFRLGTRGLGPGPPSSRTERLA